MSENESHSIDKNEAAKTESADNPKYRLSGISVLNFLRSLPQNYDTAVKNQFAQPIFESGPSYLELLQSVLDPVAAPPRGEIEKLTTQPTDTRHGQLFTLRLQDRNTGLLLPAEVKSEIHPANSETESRYVLTCDIWNPKQSRGTTLSVSYTPGSRFGYFYKSDYEQTPDPEDPTLMIKSEHETNCQCVGDQIEDRVLPVSEVSEPTTNTDSMVSLGTKMMHRLETVDPSHKAANLLLSPWANGVSDLEVIRLALSPANGYITYDEWEQTYNRCFATKSQLPAPKSFVFDANDPSSFQGIVLLPPDSPFPSLYIESQVNITRQTAPHGDEIGIINLDRGRLIQYHQSDLPPIIQFNTIEIRLNLDTGEGYYKNEQCPKKTGFDGENPRLNFVERESVYGKINFLDPPPES